MVMLLENKGDYRKRKTDSICWTCTNAYADKCRFFGCDLTWEEKLTVPSVVAVKRVAAKQNVKSYDLYKVLECPNYSISNEGKTLLRKQQRQKQKKKSVPTIDEQVCVPTIEEARV